MTYYKVVKCIRTPELEYWALTHTIVYRLGETATPPIRKSPLMAFETLERAKDFMAHSITKHREHAILSGCGQPYTGRIPHRLLYGGASAEFEDFWSTDLPFITKIPPDMYPPPIIEQLWPMTIPPGTVFLSTFLPEFVDLHKVN